MAWRLTTRVGGRVERRTFSDGAAALAALEERARAVRGSRREAITVAKRTYTPVVQVQARVEVRGPVGAAGGVDVRGDGSVEAYTGRFRRRPLEPERGESPYAALGRALSISAEP